MAYNYHHLRKSERPHRAFYAVPPAGLMLNVDKNNQSTITKVYTAILPTHRVIHTMSHSASSSMIPSATPSAHMSPPLINNNMGSNNNFSSNSNRNTEDSDELLPWIAPLLGALGFMGLICLVFWCCMRKKYKRRNRIQHQERRMPTSYNSWASISTLNTTAPDKKEIHASPPPAYTKQQKRLTADTLVDEHGMSSMLKNQYAPQLAFSPSLVAGEFHQQQLDSAPPLPHLMSPSDTLIDVKGESYHYSFDKRPKIEMYEPQVHGDNNPFIPYTNGADGDNNQKEEKEEIVVTIKK